ncbi:MAG TPA: lmo0937 family membrane protein [Vicinamibacterales bacterium]|nr:lmo0937 family membrane protein [Vicinamibacterales bacterium]
MPEFRLGLPAVALVFVALWVLGSISSVTFGGGIHLLLFAAIAIMVPRFIRGRRGAD